MAHRLFARYHRALQAALGRRHRCVQVWHGYSTALFLGLDQEVLLPIPQGKEHPLPPYELHVWSSEWRVERCSTVLASSDHDLALAQPTSLSLGGRPVTGWELLLPSRGIRVTFDEGWALRILPWRWWGHGESVAWWLRFPSGEYLCVNCCRQMFWSRS